MTYKEVFPSATFGRADPAPTVSVFTCMVRTRHAVSLRIVISTAWEISIYSRHSQTPSAALVPLCEEKQFFHHSFIHKKEILHFRSG